MLDYTMQTIVNQLNAMNCKTYRLGIFERSSKKMVDYASTLEASIIIRSTSKLKYENAKGREIFIGQSDGIDRALILVDDLNINQIHQMTERGVNPACIIETSPANHQLWVSLGLEPMPKDLRKIVATVLAKEFGGDLACVAANHMGRLAGFTNRKPKYWTNEGYPFVRCLEFTGRHADKSAEIRAWAIAKKNKQEELIYEEKIKLNIDSPNNARLKHTSEYLFSIYFDQWTKHNKKNNKILDYSLGDFAVVSRLLKEGFNELDIVEALIKNSPDINNRKKNHVLNYAIRTIRAAKNKL
jgi:hypothetical protein